tara:strand:+ start:3380 stop:3541 length:162 start_codon:yes stop_codon:yes gene_type:complete
MKVGDVVKLKKHCIGGGRQAIIIDDKISRIHVIIAYLDTGKAVYAYRSNLEAA